MVSIRVMHIGICDVIYHYYGCMGARNTYSTRFQLQRTKQRAKILHGCNYMALKTGNMKVCIIYGIFAHKYFFCVTHVC